MLHFREVLFTKSYLNEPKEKPYVADQFTKQNSKH
jgi:hypothetical protein